MHPRHLAPRSAEGGTLLLRLSLVDVAELLAEVERSRGLLSLSLSLLLLGGEEEVRKKRRQSAIQKIYILSPPAGFSDE